MPRHRPLRSALVAALGLGVAISAILVVLLVSSSSLEVRTVGRDAGRAERERVRAQFPGQAPCIGPDRGEPARALAPDRARPRTVHLLAWEREDDRLVRASTPYWAMRIAGVKVRAARLIAPPFEHVSVAELDRCGRGLVVDRQTAGGGWLLIWTD